MKKRPFIRSSFIASSLILVLVIPFTPDTTDTPKDAQSVETTRHSPSEPAPAPERHDLVA